MAIARCSEAAPILLSSLVLVAPAAGQDVELVADLRTAGPVDSVLAGGAATAEGFLFALEEPHGTWQLWRTGADEESARLVADLGAHRFQDGWPRSWVSLPEAALFEVGGAWWRSDGTAEGTFELLRVCDECGSSPTRAVSNGEMAFLVTNDHEPGGSKIWVSDGTVAGARLFADLGLRGLGTAGDLLALGSGLLFVAGGSRDGGGQWREHVWVADGSGSVERLGTLSVEPLNYDLGALHDGRAVFAGRESGDETPWLIATDGQRVEKLVELGPQDAHVTVVGSAALAESTLVLIEAGRSTYPSSCELWHTDGTGAGTERILQLMFESCFRLAYSPGDRTLRSTGSRAIFLRGNYGEPLELWTSDGTAAGTRVLAELDSATVTQTWGMKGYALFELGNDRGYALWASDGTEQGTALVHTSARFPAQALGSVASTWYFSADDDVAGRELWSTDGTPAGTRLAANLGNEETASSHPRSLRAGSDALYWVGDGNDGRSRVFRLDEGGKLVEHAVIEGPAAPDSTLVVGEVNGQVLVLRIEPTAEHGLISSFDASGHAEPLLPATSVEEVLRFGNRWVGSVVTWRLAGPGIPMPPDALWITDGTPAGTLLLAGSPIDRPAPPGRPHSASDPVVLGDRIYFVSHDSELGHILWSSDGTVEGTVPSLVLDELAERAYGAALSAFGGRLALWLHFLDAPPRLFLGDGSPGGWHEVELEGALPLRVLRTFPAGETQFWIADDPHADPQSLELWHFDPAKSDRARVELLGTFPSIGEMALTPNGLFFEPLGHDGRQLWLTDGTAAGTYPVDLEALGERIESAFIRKAVAGGVLLEVSTPERGRELGFTDGTARGTFLVPEINAGPAGSNLAEIEVFGERVYVSAFRPDVGQELFTFDLAQLAPPCVSSETSACLGNGRFEAVAEWTDPRSGERRAASVASTTDDTAFFWFFEPDNFEAAVKVIDGTALNGHHWMFSSGLTDLEVVVTVRDTHTGRVRTFHRPAGSRCGIADVEAFGEADDASSTPMLPVYASFVSPRGTHPAPATTPPEPCGDALCLHSGRFRIEVEWRHDATRRSGRGTPIPATDQSGHFWFFDAHNVELTAKLLDGTGVNGAWWLFHAPLTDLPYTLRVLDTATGETRTIEASGGGLCGGIEVWRTRDERSAARAERRQ